ncbi:hypothetical protein NERG_00592 [Nematocida ausubeli]|uniref:Uncharacterized protein n=1 Tax=Nematocida ausubeli (strain ATCC PRA-371 / ERTm2) TaxID=1913371 RepID=H8ZAH1_NEMA1|nr:hypothetical protein NERG_00592 [Nematocida ausubeli]
MTNRKTKSNISEKTQLEATIETASQLLSEEMHSVNGNSNEVIQFIQHMVMDKGGNRLREEFDALHSCVIKWPNLTASQKIFFLRKGLEKRSGDLEKRIYFVFHSFVSEVGVSLKDWTDELYEQIIEVLIQAADKERISPLTTGRKPPRTDDEAWDRTHTEELWLYKFLGYITYNLYTYDDVEMEFTKLHTIYPRSFLEVWKTGKGNKETAFRNLWLECKRLDEVANSLKGKKDGKGNHPTTIECSFCGKTGHKSQVCKFKKRKDDSNIENTESLFKKTFGGNYRFRSGHKFSHLNREQDTKELEDS